MHDKNKQKKHQKGFCVNLSFHQQLRCLSLFVTNEIITLLHLVFG